MQTPAEVPSPPPRSRAHARRTRALGLQGQRAGVVSRISADAIDAVVVLAIHVVVILVVTAIRYLFTRHFKLPNPPTWVTLATYWVIALIYLTSGWGATGKTFGKQVVGVRVVRADGSRLGSGPAFLRALLYLVFPEGLIWILFSRKNASVQDLLVRSVVLYDWSYRLVE
ncbi:MAG TPA: RDD family protein, partial [Actinomycetota bacterium]